MREKCKSGRRTIGYFGAALCILCVWPLLAQLISTDTGQTGSVQGPVISVTSNLVVLPVSVLDSKGGFVLGLRIENFVVFENGRPQKIAFFRQEDTPVTVGLLVDHSGSMNGKLPEVAAAAEVFARSSNSEDEMFVVNFGDDISLPAYAGKPFTNDPADLQKSIEDANTIGRTALYDAIAAGLEHLRTGDHERKALIIVSDGGDDASRFNYHEIRDLARQSKATIYAIGLIGGLYEDQNPNVLRHLAQETGGIAYFPSDVSAVSDISKRIARDLREQYTIGYEPQQNASYRGFRKIQVRVIAAGRKFHVRTRSGYLPSPPPATRTPEKS
ncbi:MAG TPA: VWA domain-containing protein [Candidatus Acidoferrales bacterium]|nr:VWA domain-containing protein [Candidatus Acidoferrales bacterium]